MLRHRLAPLAITCFQHLVQLTIARKALRTLIYIYVAGYVVFVTWGVIDDFREKDPWWDKASDLVLLPLGLVGMLLYLFDFQEPWIKSAWKVITIIIIVGQLTTNIVTRHLVLSGKTDLNPQNVSQWAILGTDLTALILLAPMVVLNVLYAFY